MDQNCRFYVLNLIFSESSRLIYSALSYPHPVQLITLLQKKRSPILFDIIMRFMSSSHHLTGWLSTECIKIKSTVLTHSLKVKPSLLVLGCFSENHLLSFHAMFLIIDLFRKFLKYNTFSQPRVTRDQSFLLQELPPQKFTYNCLLCIS